MTWVTGLMVRTIIPRNSVRGMRMCTPSNPPVANVVNQGRNVQLHQAPYIAAVRLAFRFSLSSCVMESLHSVHGFV